MVKMRGFQSKRKVVSCGGEHLLIGQSSQRAGRNYVKLNGN